MFELDRRVAMPALIGNHEDFLIVAGLAALHSTCQLSQVRTRRMSSRMLAPWEPPS